jgi:hypothetical protein
MAYGLIKDIKGYHIYIFRLLTHLLIKSNGGNTAPPPPLLVLLVNDSEYSQLARQ